MDGGKYSWVRVERTYKTLALIEASFGVGYAPSINSAHVYSPSHRVGLSQIGGLSTEQYGCRHRSGRSRWQERENAAFSCPHKACELRRWQRRVDVPERTLVLDLTRSEDKRAHRGAIE